MAEIYSDESGRVRSGTRNCITDIDGVLVGHAEDKDARTGVSVVYPERPCVMACAISGGGPGTRETDALRPDTLVAKGDAIVLSGGSVYGLEAASAITRILGARGRGFPTGATYPSPIVPSAILFDLAQADLDAWGNGEALATPYAVLGAKALAEVGVDFQQGNYGAGTGAVAGHIKGGLGSASARAQDTPMVGAMVAVNSFGSVVAPSGRLYAQDFALMRDGVAEYGEDLSASATGDQHPMARSKIETALANTSLGVVATAADLTVAEAHRVALMAQDGLARAIRPLHTPFDGDSIFALATGGEALGDDAMGRAMAVARIGALAGDCVARAVGHAVWSAEAVAGVASFRSLA